MSGESGLRASDVIRMFEEVCRDVDEKKDWLSKLDAACGDGDHGVSMGRGFDAVAETLPDLIDETPGGIFKNVGMKLVFVIGGATGPLFGTLFIEAGKAAEDASALDTKALSVMFRAGLDGVSRRGGAIPGEKTMVDALCPAVNALADAAEEGFLPGEGLRRAAAAARAGADATEFLIARQGKARYLGERALGHQDAGANSIALIFEAFAESISENTE